MLTSLILPLFGLLSFYYTFCTLLQYIHSQFLLFLCTLLTIFSQVAFVDQILPYNSQFDTKYLFFQIRGNTIESIEKTTRLRRLQRKISIWNWAKSRRGLQQIKTFADRRALFSPLHKGQGIKSYNQASTAGLGL